MILPSDSDCELIRRFSPEWIMTAAHSVPLTVLKSLCSHYLAKKNYVSTLKWAKSMRRITTGTLKEAVFIEAKTLRLERESWAECRKQPYIRAMLPTGQTCWIQSLFIHYIPACIGLARLPDAFNPDWNHAHKVAKKALMLWVQAAPLLILNVWKICSDAARIVWAFIPHEPGNEVLV